MDNQINEAAAFDWSSLPPAEKTLIAGHYPNLSGAGQYRTLPHSDLERAKPDMRYTGPVFSPEEARARLVAAHWPQLRR